MKDIKMALTAHWLRHKKSVLLATLTVAIGSSLLGWSFLPEHPAAGSDAPHTLIPGDGMTIYAAGDIADCRRVRAVASGAAKTARVVAAGLARDPTAAVLTLGDHTYPDGLLEEFMTCYEPTWGRFTDRTFPAPGNHEYYSPAAAGYYRYFGRSAGPANRGYYSFRLGHWHVVSLNSNLHGAEYQQQLEWLKSDLAQHPAHCTLAYWHHPIFSSGGHGNNPHLRQLWQILEAAGADVILASLDHDYERFARQDSNGNLDHQRGIRSFVIGTGGAKLTSFLYRKANSEIRDNSTHGVLRMVLKPSGYEWEFMPVTGGEFTDRGATLCH